MPRWPLAVLAVLVLAVPAASAARQPCWKAVINDWYVDGKIDGSWSCNCVREAIAHLPEDGKQYIDTTVLRAAEKRACARPVVRPVAARSHLITTKPKRTNWPARISASVLLVVAVLLLYRRSRRRTTSRGGPRGRGRE